LLFVLDSPVVGSGDVTIAMWCMTVLESAVSGKQTGVQLFPDASKVQNNNFITSVYRWFTRFVALRMTPPPSS